MYLLYCYLISDINECQLENNCHVAATCTNTDGSYTCACNSGFTGDGIECNGKNIRASKKCKILRIWNNLREGGIAPQTKIEHVLCTISKLSTIFFLKSNVSIPVMPEQVHDLPRWYHTDLLVHIKGALDKYSIYLFVPNSKENYEINQYQTFQLILPMRFHFMRYFVISIIPRVSHRPLCCVFIEVDF